MPHDHSHAHGHSHTPARFGRRFAAGITLNLIYVAIEGGFGIVAGSMALLADAGHNLSDVLGLALAWGAAHLSNRSPTPRRTYGYKASSTLAALANGMLLLVAIGAIGWEAVQRLMSPGPVATGIMLWVATAGVVVNAGTAALFMSGRHEDMNIRGACLHMVADAVVTVGVIVAALLIRQTGWLWLDPAVSLVIAATVLVATWRFLRDSIALAMNSVPPGIDPDAVRSWLAGLDGVTEVHDLHVWAIGTTDTALTAHLVRTDPAADPSLLHELQAGAKAKFKIGHTTVQLETPAAAACCELRPEHVV
ncbi:MAG: cation diffusion facilitator family transporter [Pseudomonadota bacterium]|nr:cation diffusion facilitator family transporter [Pseudomonadota bacterium]